MLNTKHIPRTIAYDSRPIFIIAVVIVVLEHTTIIITIMIMPLPLLLKTFPQNQNNVDDIQNNVIPNPSVTPPAAAVANGIDDEMEEEGSTITLLSHDGMWWRVNRPSLCRIRHFRTNWDGWIAAASTLTITTTVEEMLEDLGVKAVTTMRII